ncbi:MAG: sigma-54-dependent Fis family transcriptional regulator [Desulfobulbaceae bacterium]|nr:sigma-54-dependent Fis family transcriptional regulator [Desulfobulbaceae bacterium]
MATANSDVRILIVDDEFSVRDSLQAWFKDEGYTVDTAESGKEALAKLTEQEWDIFFLDLKMPGMTGLELQKKIREIRPDSTIIIITAYASVESAVEAMHNGAYDYLSKPFDPDYLALLVRNILERKKLKEETTSLKKALNGVYTAKEIIGESAGIKKMMEDIEAVADVESTVLILGESGTGKELVARAIHSNSRRRYAPIVTINCGALPESILESELFGHEKGAFTGAQYARKGKFEMADGGTIFLDEIGNVSPKIQMELLRVLEDKKFTRLGGNKEISADFRTIAATNRNLEEAMQEGDFRNDLYYRLNVFVIKIPPLRERKTDIPLLAEHFLNVYTRQMNKPLAGISKKAMDALVGHEWPGNVRELENAIERAVVICKEREIQPTDFPLSGRSVAEEGILDDSSLEAMQKQHIVKVLEQTGWNISRAAVALQIDRVTLYNKINKYKLKKTAASN